MVITVQTPAANCSRVGLSPWSVLSRHYAVCLVSFRSAATVLGDDLYEGLKITQKRRELVVTESRRRSAHEIEQIYEFEKGRRPRAELAYENVAVGQLEPMPWLVYEFATRLRAELADLITPFVLQVHSELATPRLRKLVKQFENWEGRIDEATAAAAAAVHFFTEQNLQLLALWVPVSRNARRQAVLNWIQSPAPQALSRGRNGTAV